MAWKLPELPPRFRLSHRVIVALLLLTLATLAHAQQPVAELGSWPPGTLTLFVGLWLGNHAVMTGAFDAIPPICLVPLVYWVPGMKILMWAKEPMGVAIKSLVFSNYPVPHDVPEESKTDDGCGIWEWDILSIHKTGHAPRFLLEQEDGEDKGGEKREREFKMTIKAPKSSNLDIHLTFMAKIPDKNLNGTDEALRLGLENAHDTLWKDLDNPSADQLLLCWYGLRAYQATRTLHHMWCENTKASREKYTSEQITSYVGHYKDRDLQTFVGGNEKIQIFITDAPTNSGEVSNGAYMLNSILSLKHLVAMLIYTENFPEPLEVNPLVPLLWWWSKGYLSREDNLFFALPPSEIQKSSKKPSTVVLTPTIPGASSQQNTGLGAEPIPAPTCCVIPLSQGIPEIDGGGGVIPRIPWIWSIATGATITFFTSIIGSSNPSLATSIGLLMLRPCNNDANHIDAGRPPSWNGRKRIRWSNGANSYSCGVFSGRTRVRIGNLGNGASRSTILIIVAWLAWYWQTELRQQLSFAETKPPQKWVMWIAFAIEALLAVVMLFGARVYYKWDQYIAAIGVFAGGIHISAVAGLMLWHLRTGEGLPALFCMSELFSFLLTIPCSITIIGVGSKSMPIQAMCTGFWIHVVVSSCFRWRRETL